MDYNNFFCTQKNEGANGSKSNHSHRIMFLACGDTSASRHACWRNSFSAQMRREMFAFVWRRRTIRREERGTHNLAHNVDVYFAAAVMHANGRLCVLWTRINANTLEKKRGRQTQIPWIFDRTDVPVVLNRLRCSVWSQWFLALSPFHFCCSRSLRRILEGSATRQSPCSPFRPIFVQFR